MNKDNKNSFKSSDLLYLEKLEFKDELKKQNKAYIDALKKGIILFGQDNFIKFIGEFKS